MRLKQYATAGWGWCCEQVLRQLPSLWCGRGLPTDGEAIRQLEVVKGARPLQHVHHARRLGHYAEAEE
jgi:hypothetical protein